MTFWQQRINGSDRRRRQVAKPTVCKTVIHRFESGRRLHLLRAWFAALLLSGCADPPAPAPVPGPADLPRWSQAPYVSWTGPGQPVTRPLVVFVDRPGGPLDRVAEDVDVATFLNDRFHPWFLVPEAAPGLVAAPPAALILDARGCVRAAPFLPETPADWIARANEVLLALDRGEPATARLPEVAFTFPLAPDHPLRGRCGG